MTTPNKDFEKSFNVVTWLQDQKKETIQKLVRDLRYPYSIALVNLNGGLNIGMIMRSACLYGCDKVYLLGQRKYDKRAAVGAHHYLDTEHIGDSKINDHSRESRMIKDYTPIDETAFIEVMKRNDTTPIFIEQGGINILEAPWGQWKHKKICFVFGNESRGIPDNILATQKVFPGSIVMSLPQHGVMRSLNVAVAAGIVMWEYYRNMVVPATKALLD